VKTDDVLVMDVARDMAAHIARKMIYHCRLAGHHLPDDVASNAAANISLGVVAMCIKAMGAMGEPQGPAHADSSSGTQAPGRASLSQCPDDG
jgi:hypothetical protein